MSVQTTGTAVEQKTPVLFTFPRGLPGLDQFRCFLVEPIPGNRLFAMLVSADDPSVGMILVDPHPFFPGYRVNVFKADRRDLQLKDDHDMVVFTTVTVEGKELFTNLAAPILINVVARRGKQVVLPECAAQMRVPLDPGSDQDGVS